MVEPIDRARFLGRFGRSLSEPPEPVADEDIARILAREELSFDDRAGSGNLHKAIGGVSA